MWNYNEKKGSIWTRLDADVDIDELIYGDHSIHEHETDESASDR